MAGYRWSAALQIKAIGVRASLWRFVRVIDEQCFGAFHRILKWY